MLGGPLHPIRLIDFGDFFMTSPVVPTLMPDIDMLAPVVGAPLDLIHFIVGVRLGPFALCTPPYHGRGHH